MRFALYGFVWALNDGAGVANALRIDVGNMVCSDDGSANGVIGRQKA